MFLFNTFTCLSSDDWSYAFIWGTNEPVQSLGDILKSQHIHYMVVNGRFIVHFLVQLFDGLLGKSFFNVFNALIFAVFIYEIVLITSNQTKHYYKIISIAFILSFFFFAGFKHVFLWLSGSFNYLWVGTGILLFHYLLLKENISSQLFIPLFILGLICGWSNEAVVIGIGISYFLYFITHMKCLKGHRRYMLAGFYVGVLLLVCSPGSIHRAVNESGMGNSSLWVSLYNMNNLRLFFILLLLLIVKVFCKKIRFKEWVRKEQILILATVFCLMFVVFTGIDVARSRFGIELFSLLLVLRMIDWDRINNLFVTCLNVPVFILVCYILVYCAHCYNLNMSELSQINRNNQLVKTNIDRGNQFLRRYTLDYAFKSVICEERDDKFYGEHEGLSKYYGYDHIYFVPRSFYDNLRTNQHACDTIYTNIDLPFYALKSAGTIAHNATISYFNNSELELSMLQRVLGRITGKIYKETVEIQPVIVEGECYLLIPKLYPNQDDHVKEIKLK